MGIKNSIPRLDAVDKVTGAAKYTEDLIPINALVGKDSSQHHCKWNSTRY